MQHINTHVALDRMLTHTPTHTRSHFNNEIQTNNEDVLHELSQCTYAPPDTLNSQNEEALRAQCLKHANALRAWC